MGDGTMTLAEAGRLGGAATRDRHDAAHYRALGRRTGRALLASRGPGYFRRIGDVGRRTQARRAEARWRERRNDGAGSPAENRP